MQIEKSLFFYCFFLRPGPFRLYGLPPRRLSVIQSSRKVTPQEQRCPAWIDAFISTYLHVLCYCSCEVRPCCWKIIWQLDLFGDWSQAWSMWQATSLRSILLNTHREEEMTNKAKCVTHIQELKWSCFSVYTHTQLCIRHTIMYTD